MGKPSKERNGKTHESSELEDGELEDDFDENLVYEKIERPVSKKQEAPPVIIDESEEEEPSSGDDSEDDIAFKKKKKTGDATTFQREMDCGNDEFRKAAQHFQANKNKVNQVWNSVFVDDEIAAEVTSMAVRRFINRQSENYPMPPETEESKNRKRARTKFRHPKIRVIQPIDNPEEYDDEELAKEIAARLTENNTDGIGRVVKLAGREMALKLLSATIDQEAVGGVQTQDSRRRRTPGGTYFYFVRLESRIPKKIKNKILYVKDPEAAKEAKKRRRKRVNEKRRQKEQQIAAPEELPELPTVAEVFEKQKAAEAQEITGNGNHDPVEEATMNEDPSGDNPTHGDDGAGEETAMNGDNAYESSTHTTDMADDNDAPFIDATFEDDL